MCYPTFWPQRYLQLDTKTVTMQAAQKSWARPFTLWGCIWLRQKDSMLVICFSVFVQSHRNPPWTQLSANNTEENLLVASLREAANNNKFFGAAVAA